MKKISRTVAAVALAGALALAPSAAFGYGASDYTNRGTASDTTPAVGQSFTITIVGPPGARVILTITSNPATLPDSAITLAGTRSLAKTTDATGTAVFTVTLNQPGSFTAVATDAVSGEVLSTQTFAVSGAAPGTPSSAGQLSATGSNALPLALGAGALLAAGAGSIVYAKRRRAAAHA